MNIKRKLLTGILAISLAFGGMVAVSATYAGPFAPFYQMENHQMALGIIGMVAAAATIGMVANAAASARSVCHVYYTHNCTYRDGQQNCYSVRHYGEGC